MRLYVEVEQYPLSEYSWKISSMLRKWNQCYSNEDASWIDRVTKISFRDTSLLDSGYAAKDTRPPLRDLIHCDNSQCQLLTRRLNAKSRPVRNRVRQKSPQPFESHANPHHSSFAKIRQRLPLPTSQHKLVPTLVIDTLAGISKMTSSWRQTSTN